MSIYRKLMDYFRNGQTRFAVRDGYYPAKIISESYYRNKKIYTVEWQQFGNKRKNVYASHWDVIYGIRNLRKYKKEYGIK